jgi:hypothetical protein
MMQKNCDQSPSKSPNRKSRSCAVYAFAALEDYAGFSKPNDMLERLAKELLSDEPKQKPRWGTQQKPNLQFQTAPAPHEGWVPPWRKNA